jgi:predicted ATP-grasp superfamily ATP-dependent carboligase
MSILCHIILITWPAATLKSVGVWRTALMSPVVLLENGDFYYTCNIFLIGFIIIFYRVTF